MYWYFEAVTPHSRQPSFHTLRSKAKAVGRDQGRVIRATARDNAYIQHVVRQTQKWDTPADSYIATSGSPRREWASKVRF